MRILLAHTFYKQPGGEDRVFEAESALLRRYGHEVVEYRAYNRQIDDMSPAEAAAKTIWNREAYSRLSGILERERPDICHFHNTFPLMSPSALFAVKAKAIPVVATLHNYRLLCPAATFLRGGRVCEACLPSVFPWRAVVHGCYRASRPASAVTALMLGSHRLLRTWTRMVDVYVTVTRFARDQFVRGGLPPGKIVVKPNFVTEDAGPCCRREDFALYVGRLSPEKGIATLLAAWRRLAIPMPLKIAGDGPLASTVAAAAAGDSRIEWLGALAPDRVAACMKRAYLLVFPSIWYEGLPLTIIEAQASGLPVVASRIGSLVELIDHESTGLHFLSGDAQDLARSLTWAWSNRGQVGEMGLRARRLYRERYTPESNYRQLMDIYNRASRAAVVRAPTGSARPARSYTFGSH
ncbi:MAG TPA: glycosyltransferase family 4 protein [Bryobacteraceae bacterium]|nr:glycosyltransferase family 4 protein [Bryobacteraceae bacterium]